MITMEAIVVCLNCKQRVQNEKLIQWATEQAEKEYNISTRNNNAVFVIRLEKCDKCREKEKQDKNEKGVSYKQIYRDTEELRTAGVYYHRN
jgi:hypothetical protein